MVYDSPSPPRDDAESMGLKRDQLVASLDGIGLADAEPAITSAYAAASMGGCYEGLLTGSSDAMA